MLIRMSSGVQLSLLILYHTYLVQAMCGFKTNTAFPKQPVTSKHIFILNHLQHVIVARTIPSSHCSRLFPFCFSVLSQYPFLSSCVDHLYMMFRVSAACGACVTYLAFSCAPSNFCLIIMLWCCVYAAHRIGTFWRLRSLDLISPVYTWLQAEQCW